MNHQCYYILEVLIVLTLRVLSMEEHDAQTSTIDLLRYCRSVAFRWLEGLESSLRKTTEPTEITATRRSLLITAILCRRTFDFDEVLTSEDMVVWTSASMTIRANTPGASEELPKDLRRLSLHDTKLSQALNGRVQDILTAANDSALDRAMSRMWSAFRSPADEWEYFEHQKGRWIYKKTFSGPNIESQTVSYNSLSGELLVDGRPLGLLPRAYTSHRTFIRLFGAQILRASSSDMPGMLYMTTGEIYGHQFHFTMQGQSLVIRAKHASTTIELIPHEHFADDLPTIFVEDYTHWLNLETGVVEFRPLTRKWTADDQNWRLIYRSQGNSYLESPEARLVDIRSRACQNTVDVLGGIETKCFMHITRSSEHEYTLHLPHLGLHFARNGDGDLECQELRMIVDPNQSLGTLVGLESRLVLWHMVADHRSLIGSF